MPSLSTHLLEEFETRPQQQPQHIVQSGAMEYNVLAHGHRQQQNPVFSQFSQAGILNAYGSDASFSADDARDMAVAGISHAPPGYQHIMALQKQREEEQALKTAKSIATLQAKLNQKLGPEYISQRPGPSGGPKLTYAEGWKVINLANEVFGFNGWSSSIVSLTVDYIDYNQDTQRYNVGVTAILKVCLRDGVSHEDIGYGMLENCKSKGMALDKCKKEAVTDALKRTLRTFGNVLGNCLYDKEYIKEVLRVKTQPPPKLQPQDLHRPKGVAERENQSANHTKPHPPLAPPPVPTPAVTPIHNGTAPKQSSAHQTALPASKLPILPRSAGAADSSLAQSSGDDTLYRIGSDDDSMFADISFDEISGVDFADRSRILPPTISNFDPPPGAKPSGEVQALPEPPRPAPPINLQPIPVEPMPRDVKAQPATTKQKSSSTMASVLAGLADLDSLSQPLSSSPSLKSRTPSGGGFVIPPGVARPQRPILPTSNNSKSSSGIGTKRPVDALNSGTLGKNGPTYPESSTARNVLAELELSTNGIVKRPRIS
ncbi:DNA repair protein rad52 [Serendipita sp. 398]|nr:DNA repair protein rad52 [Serendipita sp. 398]